MALTRTHTSPPIPDCSVGQRDQLNALSHWLDASNCYGSNLEEFDNVRNSTDPARMKTGLKHDLLPLCGTSMAKNPKHIPETCKLPKQCPENHCAIAGDFRANEQPGLTAMHTIWMRNHNKIVEELENIPKFSKERMERDKLFYEARKINIAQYQHIIYNEWLPIILGEENMKKGKISLKKDGHATNYDKDAKTQIANEFAGAAFRFGHSMVPKEIPLKDSKGNLKVNKQLGDSFFAPGLITNGSQADSIADIARGYSSQKAAAWDNTFEEVLINQLFGNLDLTALNIQRARDWGITGYNKYRGWCKKLGHDLTNENYDTVTNFADLTKGGALDSIMVDTLKNKAGYAHVDDIDLFVAGTMEKAHGGSLLGPTFTCILYNEFERLKVADRFWYENGQVDITDVEFQDPLFTLDQLKEIRKTTFARILCDNTAISEIQLNPFIVSEDYKACDGSELSSHKMDFDKWAGV